MSRVASKAQRRHGTLPRGIHREGQRSRDCDQISQETLGEMVGTTRSRVSFFMNRFRN
jgi:hypothetical protein